jgi:hypothetical protein
MKLTRQAEEEEELQEPQDDRVPPPDPHATAAHCNRPALCASNGEEETKALRKARRGRRERETHARTRAVAGSRQSLSAYCVKEEKARAATPCRGRGKDAKRCTRSRPWSPSARAACFVQPRLLDSLIGGRRKTTGLLQM